MIKKMIRIIGGIIILINLVIIGAYSQSKIEKVQYF